MPVKHCCYGECNSDSRYIGLRPEMDGVTFIPFPKPKTQREKCERWVKNCGRKFFDVSSVKKETYICSKHFVGEKGPTEAHPDPLPALSTEFEKRLLSSKKKRKSPKKRVWTENRPKRKRLDLSADESNETGKSLTGSGENNETSFSDDVFNMNIRPLFGDHNYAVQVIQPALQTDDSKSTESLHNCDEDIGCTHSSQEYNAVPADQCTSYASTGVQTDVCLDDISDYSTEDLKSKQQLQRKLFLQSVLKDDASCKFYTGLTLSIYTILFSWVSKKAEKLNYWRGQDTTEATKNQKRGPTRKLTLKEEFLVTLIRLRRGFDMEVLSDLFGVHSSLISRIFTTWINFLYLEYNFLISWPSKEQILSRLPKQFKYFSKTRVIIDCTEFFIQKPSLPSSQRVTWSQYKHHNTFKALIGISPTGAFIFVSKLFTGSISDRQIVLESGFLDKLEHGDDVMADRGFLIRDVLARRNATLNIPPFSMNKQMSAKAVTKTRRIASARIHVERAIGRLKNFKILQGVIPLKLHAVLDQTIIVCAVLCNLDNQLVKK